MKLKKNVILSIIIFAIILIIWEVIVKVASIPLYVLPAPSKILSTLISERSSLIYHGGITLYETVIGFIIAALVGVLLAILMDAFEIFRMAVYPILVVTQTIPVIVLAPILIIYLGFGMAPKIFIVILMCFFPIAISFTDGMAQCDKGQINLLRSFGASKLQIYTMVKFPSAVKQLFSGMKVAATYSITGAVVGEWLSSERGLGYYMLRVKNGYMLDKVFACVIVIILLSLLMNGVVKLLQYIILSYERDRKRS